MINWDGTLPIRRYAIFRNTLGVDYAIVVTGEDISRAESWGGFVSWLGGVRRAETRGVSVPNNEVRGARNER